MQLDYGSSRLISRPAELGGHDQLGYHRLLRLLARLFDTDTKSLYVEREVAHLDARVDGTIEMQTATMDIADYLKQGGQTAGHRELWRLLRTLFEETNDTDELI